MSLISRGPALGRDLCWQKLLRWVHSTSRFDIACTVQVGIHVSNPLEAPLQLHTGHHPAFKVVFTSPCLSLFSNHPLSALLPRSSRPCRSVASTVPQWIVVKITSGGQSRVGVSRGWLVLDSRAKRRTRRTEPTSPSDWAEFGPPSFRLSAFQKIFRNSMLGEFSDLMTSYRTPLCAADMCTRLEGLGGDSSRILDRSHAVLLPACTAACTEEDSQIVLRDPNTGLCYVCMLNRYPP